MARTQTKQTSAALRGREWRAANPDRARANRLRWRTANPSRTLDSARKSARKWRAAHPEYSPDRTHERARYAADSEYAESIRERARALYAIDPARARAKARERISKWSAERWRAKARRRRARIAQVLATLTTAEWEAILEAAGRACIYCGSTEQITQDHLIPISRGGPHTAENVAPACLSCNSQKHTKTATEFLAEAAA